MVFGVMVLCTALMGVGWWFSSVSDPMESLIFERRSRDEVTDQPSNGLLTARRAHTASLGSNPRC